MTWCYNSFCDKIRVLLLLTNFVTKSTIFVTFNQLCDKHDWFCNNFRNRICDNQLCDKNQFCDTKNRLTDFVTTDHVTNFQLFLWQPILWQIFDSFCDNQFCDNRFCDKTSTDFVTADFVTNFLLCQQLMLFFYFFSLTMNIHVESFSENWPGRSGDWVPPGQFFSQIPHLRTNIYQKTAYFY